MKNTGMQAADNREKCIIHVMNRRDLTRSEAEAEVDQAIEELGITYNQYRKGLFCQLSPEDQVRKAEFLKDEKEDKRIRVNEMIRATMDQTGWNRKRALSEMKALKEKFGIDFESYVKYGFAFVPKKKVQEKYNALKNRITVDQERRLIRSQCIWRTMKVRNIDRFEAADEVDETVEKLGISYKAYDDYSLNRYEPMDKEWAYRTQYEQKQKKREERQEKIKQLVDSGLYTKDEINDMYNEYSRKYGVRWSDFFGYKLYELNEKQLEEMFFMGYMQKLMKKYNKDKVLTGVSVSKEQTNLLLKKYITRKWCVNRNLTFEQFKELFDGEPGIVYKPNYGFQARGVQVMYFNGDMEGVYKKVMSYSHGVVEEIIKQHPEMKKLSPESVNCMRVVSVSSQKRPVLADGSMKDIAYVSLKIGRNGNIVDNVIAGGMVANVDLETGTVATHGINHDLEVIERHPDTGMPIKGFKIPYFKETLELVYTIIDELKLGGTIGWDIAVGENGPQIVEPNFGPAASLLQDPYWPEKIGMKHRMTRYLYDGE